MFTGIIAAIGTIDHIAPLMDHPQSGLRLSLSPGKLDLTDVVVGDSIAINGACMTVVAKEGPNFYVDISNESLRLTTGLNKVGPVNLEKAMTLATPIGGHLVTGHVDGLGTIQAWNNVNESVECAIAAPTSLAKYLAYKGSVVVNGVSLTVNCVQDLPNHCEFSVNLIPHTLSVTTLQTLKTGDKVNLEVDLIARYVERMLTTRSTIEIQTAPKIS